MSQFCLRVHSRISRFFLLSVSFFLFSFSLLSFSFGGVQIHYGRPAGYDMVRGAEIGNKNVELTHIEEAFTSEHWMVRQRANNSHGRAGKRMGMQLMGLVTRAQSHGLTGPRCPSAAASFFLCSSLSAGAHLPRQEREDASQLPGEARTKGKVNAIPTQANHNETRRRESEQRQRTAAVGQTLSAQHLPRARSHHRSQFVSISLFYRTIFKQLLGLFFKDLTSI